MWLQNIFIVIVFKLITGLCSAEMLGSVSNERSKGCSLIAVHDEEWACSITLQFEIAGEIRLGDNSTCWLRKNTYTSIFQCSDGLWKRINSISPKTKRSLNTCPGDIYLLIVNSTSTCKAASWSPPLNSIKLSFNGNSGDCFPVGVTDILYVNATDVCKFHIHVTDQKTIIVCESGSSTISCPNFHHIKIVSANYGRLSSLYCPGEMSSSTSTCNSPSSASVVSNSCNDRPTCTVTATNEIFHGDPCGNVFKYLTVTYICEPALFCDTPPPIPNGYRYCFGDSVNAMRAVCSHGCQQGYILQGNMTQECGLFTPSSTTPNWNSSFPICSESCSWFKNHCWPGECSNHLATNCVCRHGFREAHTADGVSCMLDTPPNVRTCIFYLTNPAETTESQIVDNVTRCDDLRYELVKTWPMDLHFIVKAEVNLTSGPLTSYVSLSSVGVVDVHITLKHIAVLGTEQIVSTLSLRNSSNCKINDTAVMVCDGVISLSALDLNNGESLCADIEALSGGFYILQDDSGHIQNRIPFQPISTKKRTCFLLDRRKPIHCSENGCPLQPLQLSTRTTRTPNVRVLIDGWKDPETLNAFNLSMSLIDRYKLEIHRVHSEDSRLTVQDEAIHDCTIDWRADISPGTSYNFSVNLPDVTLQMYAFILEVHDLADNVGYARRLLMFDNSSTVEIRHSEYFNVLTAYPGPGSLWQSGISTKVCLEWRDRFYDTDPRATTYLLPVQSDTQRQIIGHYDQIDGLLPVNGTENVQGVVKFEISWGLQGGLMAQWESVQSVRAQSACFTENLSDGDACIIRIRASDVMGNAKVLSINFTDTSRMQEAVLFLFEDARRKQEDNVTIHVDQSSPEVKVLSTGGTFGRDGLHVTSDTELSEVVLLVQATDTHSGIRELRWEITENGRHSDRGSGLVSVDKLSSQDDCATREYCYCPKVGSCEVYQYRFMFSFREYTSSNLTNSSTEVSHFYVTLSATNYAGLRSNDSLDVFIDTSSPSSTLVLEGLIKVSPETDTGKVDTLWAIVGGVLGAVAVIVVVVVAVLLCQRRIQRRRNEGSPRTEFINPLETGAQSNVNHSDFVSKEVESGPVLNYEALELTTNGNDRNTIYTAINPSKQQNDYGNLPSSSGNRRGGANVRRKVPEPPCQRAFPREISSDSNTYTNCSELDIGLYANA